MDHPAATRPARTLTTFLALAAAVLPATACSDDPPEEKPPTPPLVGLADFHNHQFAHLGFGGHAITHSPDPADPCMKVPPFAGNANRVKDIIRDQMFSEAKSQEDRGECFPTSTSWAGQRVDTANLERAWRYGLRLMVMLAVSNEYLCQLGGLGEDPELDDPINRCPTDRKAIEAQLEAARALEAKIDGESGGPGSGWYRIVTTPAEARQVIGDGKLAVVLGTEAVNAFGCKIVARDVVAGVPNLGGEKPEEQTYRNFCGSAPTAGRPDVRTQTALAVFERYWGLGARHFFPIHNMDGISGGTAAYIPVLHSDQNPTRLAPGDILDRVREIDRVIVELRPPFHTTSCPAVEFDGGRCNVLGLTDTGRALIRMMASRGAVLDIDHMSRKAKNEVLGKEGLLGGVYPFVSSHSGPVAISHRDASNEGRLSEEDFAAMIPQGGAFAPVLPPVSVKADGDTWPRDATVAKHDCGGTSESFVQAYRYVVDKLRGTNLLNGRPAFVGVGFGTDFTAPGTGGPAPRFDTGGAVEGGSWLIFSGPTVVKGGSTIGKSGNCYLLGDPSAPSRVQYPFTSPLADPQEEPVPFERSNVPWSGARPEPYDVSTDGIVHIGMIPDFVEELRTMGLGPAELEPLWHGAEAYIREWEAATAWKGSFDNEDSKGIEESCSALRAQLLAAVSAIERVDALESLAATGCHGT